MKLYYSVFLILVCLGALSAQFTQGDDQNTWNSQPANSFVQSSPQIIVDPPVDGSVPNYNSLTFQAPKTVYFVDYDETAKRINCEAFEDGTYFSGESNKNLVTMKYKAHFAWNNIPTFDDANSGDYTWQARVLDINKRLINKKYKDFDLDTVRFYLSLVNNHNERENEFFIFTAKALLSSPKELVSGSLPLYCDQTSYFPAQPGDKVDVVFGANEWPAQMPSPVVQFVRRNACSAPIRSNFNNFQKEKELYLQGNPSYHFFCRTDQTEFEGFPTQCCHNYKDDLDTQGFHKVSMQYIGDGEFVLGTSPTPQQKCEYGHCPAIDVTTTGGTTTGVTESTFTGVSESTFTGFTGDSSTEPITHTTQPPITRPKCEELLQSFDYYGSGMLYPSCSHSLYGFNIYDGSFSYENFIGEDYAENLVLSLGKIKFDYIDPLFEEGKKRDEHDLSGVAIGFDATIELSVYDETCYYQEDEPDSVCLYNIMSCLPQTYLYATDGIDNEPPAELATENANIDFTAMFQPGTYKCGNDVCEHWPSGNEGSNAPDGNNVNFSKNIPVTLASINYFNRELPQFDGAANGCGRFRYLEPQSIFDVTVANAESATILAAWTTGIIPHKWVTPAIDYNIVGDFEGCPEKKKSFIPGPETERSENFDLFESSNDAQMCDGTSHITLITYREPNWTPRIVEKSYEDFGLTVSSEAIRWLGMDSAYGDISGDVLFPYYPINGCMRSVDTFLNFLQTKAYSLVVVLRHDDFADEDSTDERRVSCHSAWFSCQNPDGSDCFEEEQAYVNDCPYSHNLWIVDSDGNMFNLDLGGVFDELDGAESTWSIYHASGSMDCHNEFTLFLQFIKLDKSSGQQTTRQFIVMFDENFENPFVRSVPGATTHASKQNRITLLNDAEAHEDTFIALYQWYILDGEREGWQDSWIFRYFIR